MKSIRIHLIEMKLEFLKALRTPAYAIPTIAFPVIFYIFFGVAFGAAKVPGGGGVNMSAYMIATYGTFGVLAAAMFGFAVQVAMERGQGWLELKRTTPMPISAYFAAKMVMALAFSTIVVSLLFLLGTTWSGVRMPVGAAVTMFVTLVGGSLSFCALGLAIGYFATPSSAAAIANVVFMPMSFLSGLWVPIFALPKFIQKIALVLPTYHLSQLALGTIGVSRGSVGGHVAALVSITAVLLAVAYAGYRRDEGKMYG
jgi:ABC-2 type transport system permease protein